MARGYEVDLMLPDVESDELIQTVAELGWFQIAGAGDIAPVAWSEVQAFCSITQLDLTPFEAKLVRSVSAGYCKGRINGSKKNALPPAVERQMKEDPAARQRYIASTMRAMLRSGVGTKR